MKAIGNNVVIKIDRITKPFEVGGQELLIDHSWSPGEYPITYGVISSVSDSYLLDYMEWQPVIDIRVGDKVWFQRYEAALALGRELDRYMGSFEERDSLIDDKIIIPYSSLFCVEREGQLIMQNGYVLVEPIDHESDSIMELPVKYLKKELSLGRVYATGSANKSYDYPAYVDTINYNVGDLVLFRRYNNFVHEDIYNKSLYKIQRRNIIAVHHQEGV